MERLRDRFYQGAAANGITGELADTIFGQIEAFSGYGFPEAHSMSFALLVYASAYVKFYHPAAFCAGLLRAQPMGFYSPQSLVADARRHGVTVHSPDINRSLVHPTLEPCPGSTGGVAVRLGLGGIRNLGADHARTLVDERETGGPYTGMVDLGRRTSLTEPQLEALATGGAFTTFGGDRRQALWTAGAVARDRAHYLPGTATAGHAPSLPGMSAIELAAADVWATGVTPDRHPVEFLRDHLTRLGALSTAAVADVPDGTRILVGGAVTHRQRPATAGGITFLNLEDETGMLNIVCSPGLWTRQRAVARDSAALLIRGTLQNTGGVCSLNADLLRPLTLHTRHVSRDFR
jgi:error-prone DNA polymerase